MNKPAKRLLLCVAACGIAFLLAEVSLRLTDVLIGRHTDHMFVLVERDEVLGWRLKRNASMQVDLIDTENVRVQTNTDGVWDHNFATCADNGGIRIAFLGDSFTWGYGVES